MGAYIIRRLIAMVLMLIALSMIVFLIFNALPADPARLTCGKSCSPQIIAANRHRLGLDKPLDDAVRRVRQGHLRRAHLRRGQGDLQCHAPCLGYSFRKGEQVTDLHRGPASRSPSSWRSVRFILWIVAGVSVGIIAALRRGKWQDRSIMGVALVGYSFPSFFIGLLLVYFVQIKWGIIGFGGYVPFFDRPRGLVPGAHPALDRPGPALRGVLRPAHPQPDARDPR